MANKIILVDRDGVINRDLAGSVRTLEDFQLLEGTGQAIAQLCAAGYLVLVVTNQACVGRGWTDIATLAEIHRKMCAEIKEAGGEITDIFVCPHTPEEKCQCRKPLPGLIFQAQSKYSFIMEETWLVGDADRDFEAARQAGCRPVRVLTGKGAEAEGCVEDIPVFANLLAFSDYLVGSVPSKA